MNNIFRLKKELIWNLTDTHIEFFVISECYRQKYQQKMIEKCLIFLHFINRRQADVKVYKKTLERKFGALFCYSHSYYS